MLRATTLILAQTLQEAAESLSSNELRSKLSDAVSKAHSGSQSGYYQDHVGDEDSGDCIYQCYGGGESNTMKAPYSKGTDSSDEDYTLHTDKAVKVVPRTTYVEQPDEADHYSAMESAKLYTKGAVPICERFVSKKERDAAGSGDFAGKNKSFPILKAADVSAAASSIGRAGSDNYSTDVIKKNIIRIAKAKGWASELPKAWQDGGTDSSESRRTREARKPMKDCPDCEGTGDGKDDEDCDTCGGTGKVPMFAKSKESRASTAGGLKLVETTMRASDAVLELIESAAGAEMEVKLIAPGKGSSAFYTPEALKQSVADGIFDNAQIYINHATKAEESARPEGDWHDLAGGIKGKPYYLESHKQGPGLYGKAVFTPQYAPEVRAKAAISGMSIRANGDAVMESSGRPQLRQGVPVLKKFTSAESVDIVTRAGAGGMILTESARGAQQQEPSMNAEEKLHLQRLVEKDIRREAIELGARTLEGVSLNESAKMYIIETVVDKGVPKEAGALDSKKFVEAVNAEARRFGGAIGAGPRVTGMGTPPPVELTEAQRVQLTERRKAEDEQYREAWAGLFDGDVKLAEVVMKGRAN
jgi:hypothetical protein